MHPSRPRAAILKATLEAMSRQVELKLLDFNIQVDVVAVSPGPVITRFELQPAPGVKAVRSATFPKTWRAHYRWLACASLT